MYVTSKCSVLQRVRGVASETERDDRIYSLVDRMTLTKLSEEAGFDPDQISKTKLLVVDMGAPVGELKKQFLELLERQPRLKRSPYDEWEEYGILPFLDLDRWERASSTKIKPDVRAGLIYPRRLHVYGPKKIDETTRPHIKKLLDGDGPLFRGLLADASEEFWEVVSDVRKEDEPATSALAEEALTRWFPRTFPFNLPDLERASRMFPKSRTALQQSIELAKSNELTLSLSERIREMSLIDDGTDMLRVMEGLCGEHHYVCGHDTYESAVANVNPTGLPTDTGLRRMPKVTDLPHACRKRAPAR